MPVLGIDPFRDTLGSKFNPVVFRGHTVEQLMLELRFTIYRTYAYPWDDVKNSKRMVRYVTMIILYVMHVSHHQTHLSSIQRFNDIMHLLDVMKNDVPVLPLEKVKLNVSTLYAFYKLERKLYLKSKKHNIVNYKHHYKHLKDTFETVSKFVETHVKGFSKHPNFQPIREINPQYLETFVIKDIFSH